MFKRMLVAMMFLLMAVPITAHAQQLQVVSQPDRIHVFQNNMAYVQDTLSLPGGADVELVLPAAALVDTLILLENGERVANYRVRRDNAITIGWQSTSSDGLREITAAYLMQGLSWQPKYDMVIHDETASASFDFFAEIQNTAFDLDEVEMFLVAGSVGTSQILDGSIARSFNQTFVDEQYGDYGGAQPAISNVTIQHIYALGTVHVLAQETLYSRIVSGELPVRRVLLWNAQSDTQITVIYKVKNETDQPFAPGIVRSYREGLILGSDGIERTPIGSEGSVTVGTLPDVRVARDQSSEQINRNNYFDTRRTVTLEMANFGDETITLEVIDFSAENAIEFEFADEPSREPGNVLRWVFTLEPGETRETTYSYVTP
jgi:hypothetical protein